MGLGGGRSAELTTKPSRQKSISSGRKAFFLEDSGFSDSREGLTKNTNHITPLPLIRLSKLVNLDTEFQRTTYNLQAIPDLAGNLSANQEVKL